MSAFFQARGYSVREFEWSGIPTGWAVRSAASRLEAVREPDDETFVITKSVGADVVNLVIERLRPRRVVAVAPAFVVSREFLLPRTWAVIDLARDAFLDFWCAVHVVRRIPIPEFAERHLIPRAPGLTHHTLNDNTTLALSNAESISSYELYARVLEGEFLQ